jgi:TPR repeat protein
MHGNVNEWVEDCYYSDYEGAPTNGEAAVGDCNRRIARGGSWNNTPWAVRSAQRKKFTATFRNLYIGFRIARDIPADAEQAYRRGRNAHTKEDFTEAAKWYRIAADQGYMKAPGNLGLLYLLGRGVQKDIREAHRLTRLAANQGGMIAQHRLGLFYLRGIAVNYNRELAVSWLRKSAAQRYTRAIKQLAKMGEK